MLSRKHLAFVLAAAIAVGACTSTAARNAGSASSDSSGSASSSSSGAPAPGPTPRCLLLDLKIKVQAARSAPPGHHPLLFVLQNLGAGPCTVRGYPRVGYLGGDGATLPTTDARQGGAVVTTDPPAEVVLAVQGFAFFVSDQPACTGPDGPLVAQTSIGIPDDPSTAINSAPVPSFASCLDGDPSTSLEVSPLVADPNRALAQPSLASTPSPSS